MPWLTYKNLLGNTIQVPYALGETVLGIFAIFIRDYVTLQWVMSMVCFIQLPLWLILPESPRWLLSKGRVEEARAIMARGAKWNRKEVDLSALKNPTEKIEKQDELGFADLFRSKDMLIITVVMSFNWPIITMGYFGLGLSMTQLGGNIFVDFILGALVEVSRLYCMYCVLYCIVLHCTDSRLLALCAPYRRVGPQTFLHLVTCSILTLTHPVLTSPPVAAASW